MNKKVFQGIAAIPLLFAIGSASAVPMDVDGALSFVIDVSGSVDDGEYALQMDGYAAALRDGGIQTKLLAGAHGKVVVNAVFFASSAFTTTLDAFTVLDSAQDISDFADVLDTFARPGSGGTDIFDGTNKAVSLLTGVAFTDAFATTNKIIDVSGDGTDTASSNDAARDNAASNGITVNGLPIGGSNIADFYRDHVITADGFFQPANSFADFETAVRTKIDLEAGDIGGDPSGVPVPGSLALLGLGLAGLGYKRRKRVDA